MSDATEGEQPQTAFESVPGPPMIVGGDIPRFYANNTMFQVSPWDVTLDFGQLVGRTEEGPLIVQSLVRVIMSPQHAKAVANLLTINLQAYEAEFGPIPTPPTLPIAEQAKS